MKKELVELMRHNIKEVQTDNYLELKKDLTFQIVEANQLPSRTNKTNPPKDTAQLNLVQCINFKEKILKTIKRKIKLPIKNDDNLLLISNKRNKKTVE